MICDFDSRNGGEDVVALSVSDRRDRYLPLAGATPPAAAAAAALVLVPLSVPRAVDPTLSDGGTMELMKVLTLRRKVFVKSGRMAGAQAHICEGWRWALAIGRSAFEVAVLVFIRG